MKILNHRKKVTHKKQYRTIFIVFTVIAAVLAIIFRNVVDVVLIYAAVTLFIATIVLYHWIFKISQKHTGNMYRIGTAFLIAMLVFSNLDPVWAVSGILIVPLAHGASIVISKVSEVHASG